MRRLLLVVSLIVLPALLHGQPFDSARGQPFDSAQGKPFDSAQGKPFDSAQGQPFDSAQGKQAPRDLVLAPKNAALAVKTTVPRGYALIVGIANYKNLDASKQLKYPESDADA